MYVYYYRDSPLKPDSNANSIKCNTWAYKTKLVESINLFSQEHFPDIKRRKELSLSLNVCKVINAEQKIGSRIVRRSLESSCSTNLLKFDDQVLKGFAITWYKQAVVHYIDIDKIGIFTLYLSVML